MVRIKNIKHKPVFFSLKILCTYTYKIMFLPQLAVFHIKHHESDVLVIIVKLLGLVAELSLHLDDAVEGLVGDHRLEPDVQLQEGGGMGLI